MLTGLQENTTYQYQVRTKCAVDPKVFSNYSPVAAFGTTMRMGEDNEASQVLLYPNPTGGNVTLRIPNGMPQTFTINVYNGLGQLVHSLPNVSTEPLVTLNISFLNAGVYSIETISNTNKNTLRLIKD